MKLTHADVLGRGGRTMLCDMNENRPFSGRRRSLRVLWWSGKASDWRSWFYVSVALLPTPSLYCKGDVTVISA